MLISWDIVYMQCRLQVPLVSKDFVLLQITVKDYQSSLQAEKIKQGQHGRGQLGLCSRSRRLIYSKLMDGAA